MTDKLLTILVTGMCQSFVVLLFLCMLLFGNKNVQGMGKSFSIPYRGKHVLSSEFNITRNYEDLQRKLLAFYSKYAKGTKIL